MTTDKVPVPMKVLDVFWGAYFKQVSEYTAYPWLREDLSDEDVSIIHSGICIWLFLQFFFSQDH